MKNSTISVILTKMIGGLMCLFLSKFPSKCQKKSETKEYAMDVPSKYNEIKIKVKYKKLLPNKQKYLK